VSRLIPRSETLDKIGVTRVKRRLIIDLIIDIAGARFQRTHARARRVNRTRSQSQILAISQRPRLFFRPGRAYIWPIDCDPIARMLRRLRQRSNLFRIASGGTGG